MTNQTIINVFSLLIKKYKTEQQSAPPKEQSKFAFKIRTFQKAISIIKSLKTDITSGKDLKDVKGIGAKTVEKIDEILKTGTLSSLKDFEMNSTLGAQDNLIRITGIGPVKAKSLIDQGITLAILQKKIEDIDFIETHLTHHSILGLKYLEALETKIPALEIAKIGMFMRKIIEGLNFDFTICGSFRRKKETSGDIDILFYPKKKYDPKFLPFLIEFLIKKKFLIDHLTIGGETKYMGICRLTKKGIPRRIDIRYIKKEHIAASLLYFTGSGLFNRNMRIYAIKKGFKLNEYGLFKLKPNGEPGLKMKTPTEKDIFKTLGIPYVEPENRLETFIFPK
jgi:DNA polymerase/3'-5' exonuclease PolX